jgi:hypothetical protein
MAYYGVLNNIVSLDWGVGSTIRSAKVIPVDEMVRNTSPYFAY